MIQLRQKANQLRRDLNLIVGTGRNWKIPPFLPVLLRYVSGTVLAIIFSFSFPRFHAARYDPMMIAGFILAWIGIIAMILGFVLPRYYDALIPLHRRGDGTEPTVANELKGEVIARAVEDERARESDPAEAGQAYGSDKDRVDLDTSDEFARSGGARGGDQSVARRRGRLARSGQDGKGGTMGRGASRGDRGQQCLG